MKFQIKSERDVLLYGSAASSLGFESPLYICVKTLPKLYFSSLDLDISFCKLYKIFNYAYGPFVFVVDYKNSGIATRGGKVLNNVTHLPLIKKWNKY